MSSMPESFGSPRSTMARSIGYSLAAYRPSSPSAAVSTVKPAALSWLASDSRSAVSSSTISIRMVVALLEHRSAVGIDLHGPDLAVLAEESQHVHRAALLLTRLGAHHAGIEALLHLPDDGVE